MTGSKSMASAHTARSRRSQPKPPRKRISTQSAPTLRATGVTRCPAVRLPRMPYCSPGPARTKPSAAVKTLTDGVGVGSGPVWAAVKPIMPSANTTAIMRSRAFNRASSFNVVLRTIFTGYQLPARHFDVSCTRIIVTRHSFSMPSFCIRRYCTVKLTSGGTKPSLSSTRTVHSPGVNGMLELSI